MAVLAEHSARCKILACCLLLLRQSDWDAKIRARGQGMLSYFTGPFSSQRSEVSARDYGGSDAFSDELCFFFGVVLKGCHRF